MTLQWFKSEPAKLAQLFEWVPPCLFAVCFLCPWRSHINQEKGKENVNYKLLEDRIQGTIYYCCHWRIARQTVAPPLIIHSDTLITEIQLREQFWKNESWISKVGMLELECIWQRQACATRHTILGSSKACTQSFCVDSHNPQNSHRWKINYVGLPGQGEYWSKAPTPPQNGPASQIISY